MGSKRLLVLGTLQQENAPTFTVAIYPAVSNSSCKSSHLRPLHSDNWRKGQVRCAYSSRFTVQLGSTPQNPYYFIDCTYLFRLFTASFHPRSSPTSTPWPLEVTLGSKRPWIWITPHLQNPCFERLRIMVIFAPLCNTPLPKSVLYTRLLPSISLFNQIFHISLVIGGKTGFEMPNRGVFLLTWATPLNPCFYIPSNPSFRLLKNLPPLLFSNSVPWQLEVNLASKRLPIT